jgi:hypothetical protein
MGTKFAIPDMSLDTQESCSAKLSTLKNVRRTTAASCSLLFFGACFVLWFIYQISEGWRDGLGSPRSCASLEVGRLQWPLASVRVYRLPRSNKSSC